MTIDKAKYPLAFLYEWVNFRNQLDQIILDNEEIISIEESYNDIKLIDKETSNDFTFLIKNPEYKVEINSHGSKGYLTFIRKPASITSIGPFEMTVLMETLSNSINSWLSLLKEYSNISLTKEEAYFKRYQKEYFAEFEIVDEDSNTNPFDLERQLLLHLYLKSLINYLESKSSEYDVDEI